MGEAAVLKLYACMRYGREEANGKRRQVALVALGGLLVLPGCLLVKSYDGVEAPSLEEAEWQGSAGGKASSMVTEETSWWELFGDPQLTLLVSRAVVNNRDLKQAQSRLEAAYARRGIDASGRWPQMAAEGGATRIGVGEKGASLGGPPAGTEVDFFSGGLVAGWELDLWGRVKRLAEAADAEIGVAQELYRGAMVSVAAETAVTFLEFTTATQRLANLDDSIELQESNIELLEELEAAGTIRKIEVESARNRVQQSRAKRPNLQQEAAVAENRLAILLGELPSDGLLAETKGMSSPDLIGIGVPAELIQRRPDIRQAERSYAAAVSRIGAAEAERYPKLSLSGSFKLQTLDLDNFLDEDAFVYSLGPAIEFPLFTGGRINNGIAMRRAEAEKAKWALEQSLLNAVREVEDAASGVVQSEMHLRELRKAEESAKRIESLVTEENEAGLASRIELIDAALVTVELRDQILVAKEQNLGQTIKLFRALGGGWASLQRISESETGTAEELFTPKIEEKGEETSDEGK